jgi:hypothetical protein
MSDEKLKTAILKEAEEKAKEEFKKKRVIEVQNLLLALLEKQEALKKEKALIAEKERILKLDFEDIRQGEFEKVQERHKKSKIAGNSSVTIPESLLDFTKVIRPNGTSVPYINGWYEVTSTPGTYTYPGNGTYTNPNYGLGSSSIGLDGSTASYNASYTLTATSGGWLELSSGTYSVGDKNFYFSNSKIL